MAVFLSQMQCLSLKLSEKSHTAVERKRRGTYITVIKKEIKIHHLLWDFLFS